MNKFRILYFCACRFEQQLPNVFDHFNTIYRSVSARLKAEQVRVSIRVTFGVEKSRQLTPPIETYLCSNRCMGELDDFSKVLY